MFVPHLSVDPDEKRGRTAFLNPNSSPGMLLTLRHLARLLLVSKAKHVLRFRFSGLDNLGCAVWEDQT